MPDSTEEIKRLISEIGRCEDEMNTALRQYTQRLYELKLKIARVCGHKRTTHEWAWTRCLDCGAVELTAMFVYYKSRAVSSAEAARITAW